MERIAYPGSFQPFSSRHLEVVRFADENSNGAHLVIAVADGDIQNSRNFISTTDAVNVARLTLKDNNLDTNSSVIPVKIETSMPIGWAKDLLNNERITKVYTGSPRTIQVLKVLQKSGEWTGEIVELDNQGIHSSQIREWILKGDLRWKEYVSPSATEYIIKCILR